MGECLITRRGGGLNTSDADITTFDVMNDKIAYGADGQVIGEAPFNFEGQALAANVQYAVWNCMKYYNGKFIALTDNGNTSAYSTDGITWTQGTLPTNADWLDVAYGNGKFVAVAYGSNIYAYSTDGITWTQGTLPLSGEWYSVVYGGGKFVAAGYVVADEQRIAYSTDGINWTQGTISVYESVSCRSIYYYNGKFISFCDSYKTCYSTDGITWTQGGVLPYISGLGAWLSMTYSNGKFIAAGSFRSLGNSSIAYSDDGITWTKIDLPTPLYNFAYIVYDGSKFLVLSTYGDFYYSYDTINWKNSYPQYSLLGTVIFQPSLSPAGKSVMLKIVSTTHDWEQRMLPTEAAWSCVTYGDGKFVTVAMSSNICAYSTDGINWTQGTIPASTYWDGIAYGNGKFVAIAQSSICAYSTDGITWTQRSMPSSGNWKSIVYGDGKFVTVARNSANCAYSTDGINWTQGTLPANTSWEDIAYGDGKFVAVAGTMCAYSTDGINWTQGNIAAGFITYGGGKFVTSNGYYSIDGITWSQSTMPSGAGWAGITYGNGRYIVISYNSSQNSLAFVYAYSTDGITWIKENMPESYAMFGACCYGNNKFVNVTRTYWGSPPRASNICLLLSDDTWEISATPL